MAKKSSGTPSAGNQNTDVKFSMKPQSGGKGIPGKKDMGIPPFTQKPKNVQKISPMAKSSKGVKGTDKYC